ncbi:DUF6485 family protein [Kosmotoga olearia]|uniref:Conserved hypothetical cytosolic protein n=1 Tax=Kosmotoga olearia (strain ATCC BAA-1733 / DSM 21960 / TBF 19.5.1) TaxID=521045 RepID=C5CIH8_KOSOT|nr:DUF6485 family protein [Kosmotoga olearia]ACR79841.1 conserved hypothetical cytosolic protein [Kosmotoga olearia TBF 19.5.1]
MECTNFKQNLQKCNCSYPGCPRKGKCCECLSYHRSRGELPACYFTEAQERTWNRSIEYFIQSR